MKDERTNPESEEIARARGLVRIIVERCKGCGFCIEYCPRHVLTRSDEFNRKGYHYPIVSRAGACSDCKFCEMICPDFAIYSVPNPRARGAAAREESAT